MGPGTRSALQIREQTQLLEHYNTIYPAANVFSRATLNIPPNSTYLNDSAIFYEYVILGGRRIVPSRFDGRAGNSLLQINRGGTRFVGKLQLIISHMQAVDGCTTLRETLLGVRWLKRTSADISVVWDP